MINGDNGNNNLTGTNGNDVINGAGGNDTLTGLDGRDTLNGQNGDDFLIGGAGNDRLDGGAGMDSVLYYRDRGASPVYVDLLAGTATDSNGDTDTLVSVEYVFGTEGNDTILGSNIASERLFGRGGNDLLDGRDGKNLIFTGSGNDTVRVGTTIEDARDTIVINGRGNKTITGTNAEGSDYDHHIVFAMDAPVTVNLATGIATSAGMRTDFSGALFFLELGGSAFADTLLGGNPIHDHLEWYVGNQGNDTIDGGSGSGDTIVYEEEVVNGFFNPVTGIREYGNRGAVVNLATGVATDTFGDTDTLRNIEDMRGTGFADRVTGSARGNNYWGLAGNDTLDGGAGSDGVHYRDDVLTGGSAGVTVNLVAGTATDGFGDTDTLRSIEIAFGTDTGDRMTGNASANRLNGYDGADTLSGAGGNDILLGGGGNDNLSGGADDDELWGEAGNDTLDGGAGTDTARYLNATGGANVNLMAGTAADGFGGTDRLIGIENAHGSEFGDTINGSAGDNRLRGFGGNDILNGLAGADILLGGDGNDAINGGGGDDEIWGEAGNDTIDGAAGVDLVRYRNSTSAVNVDLTAGTASDGLGGTDSLSGVENVHTSRNDDTVRGDGAENRIAGFGGNDDLAGEGGDDILLGGEGDDTISGGAGDDEIWGEAGNDRLDGGAGTDLVRYLNPAAAVSADLGTGMVADGLGGTDTLSGIENLHGSDFGDDVTGSSAGNLLSGFGGSDTLRGNGGNDTILGGVGDDDIAGGDGDDELWGEAGTDTIDGGGGQDLLRYLNSPGGIVADLGLGTVRDGFGYSDAISGIEDVHGSDFNDILRGSDDANRLFGFGGGDRLIGRGGSDILVGGAGGDTYEFFGGDGADAVNDQGSGGVDTVVFHSYLSANARIARNPGSDTMLVEFVGTGDIARLVNTFDGSHAGAIERIVWADGTIWDHAALIAGIGQAWTAASTTATGGGDSLTGTRGADNLGGLGGADILVGLEDADTLDGGSGDDTMSGGAGADSFVLSMGMGHDLVTDFDASEDSLDTSGLSAAQRDAITITTDGDGNEVHTLGDGSSITLRAVAVNRAPTGSVTMTGEARQGQTLTADASGLADADGLGSFVYHWLRDGVDIADAAGSTYTLTQADVGARVSLRVSYTDGRGNDESVTDGTTDPVVNLNDAPAGDLLILGSPRQGATLRADAGGLEDADGMGTPAFQWLHDGTPIEGETGATYRPGQEDVGRIIQLRATYTDGFGTEETVLSAETTPVANVNDAPTGTVSISGTAEVGQTLTADTSAISDADGLGVFSYGWLRNGAAIAGATEASYTPVSADAGARLSVSVRYTDGGGTGEALTSARTDAVAPGSGGLTLTGTPGDDDLVGGPDNDTIDALDGNDRLIGAGGDDTLRGGDGNDTINGGDGDDLIRGGETDADRRDVIYGGAGNDSIDGGYGNDLIYGQGGNDTIAGGFGADELQGQDGNDVITGSAFGDIVFGNAGDDFVNGGFGHDLINGGSGADKFFHVGGSREQMLGHGSDWVQDYSAAEGDVLVFGGSGNADQFQVNFTHTANKTTGERSGDDDVQEAFVIYKPTGQILWALVDGGGEASINLQIGADTFDLLA
ncbi:MAG: beta strand repeat-containing protein [Jhaorihella sp.]